VSHSADIREKVSPFSSELEFMKRIVVINDHPDKESFNSAVADSYIKAATHAGAQVRYIPIGELKWMLRTG
jgi:putative NADPH-quinone reductase